MGRLQFHSVVRLSCGPGQPVEEIDKVIDALTFLRQWPVGRRGPVYYSAHNCCAAAMTGEMTAEQARRSFVGFARITRLLAEPHPSRPGSDPYAKKRRESGSIA
mgnify:CR=1 FL=1